MEDQYHIMMGGQQAGPYSRAVLQQWLAEQRIRPTDLCWAPGMQSWEPLSAHIGVRPPTLPTGAGSGSGMAVASLVCGIISLMCGLFAGLPAIILGHLARKRALKHGAGTGVATAGLILGYVSVIVTLMLAAIAVPSFLRARMRSQATTTKNDLRLINSAIDQYAIEHNLPAGTIVTWENMEPFLKAGTRLEKDEADVMGNPYPRKFIVAELPPVSHKTYEVLSDVAPEEFWSPFPIGP